MQIPMLKEICEKHNKPATHGCIMCRTFYCKNCKNLQFHSETKLHLKLFLNQYHSELSFLLIDPHESDKWTGELRQLIIGYLKIKSLHNFKFKKTEYQYYEFRTKRCEKKFRFREGLDSPFLFYFKIDLHLYNIFTKDTYNISVNQNCFEYNDAEQHRNLIFLFLIDTLSNSNTICRTVNLSKLFLLTTNLINECVYYHYRHSSFINTPPYIFLIGGDEGNKCEYYNLKTKVWRAGPNLKRHSGCSCTGTFIFPNKIYLFADKMYVSLEILNIEMMELGWKKIQYSNGRPYEVQFGMSFSIKEDFALIIGGGNDTIDLFQVRNNSTIHIKVGGNPGGLFAGTRPRIYSGKDKFAYINNDLLNVTDLITMKIEEKPLWF